MYISVLSLSIYKFVTITLSYTYILKPDYCYSIATAVFQQIQYLTVEKVIF